jgi:hypothetical protein
MLDRMALGFFDMFFDSEYRQRSDINSLQMVESAMADDMAALGGQVRKLQVQVRELSVMNAVLLKMLEEGGHLDPKVLRYRMEAMLEEMSAPQAQVVRCVACNRTVPAARTLMTGDGPTCDPSCAP